MKKTYFARWQANFWAGLAIVLPGVISLAVLRWLFGTVANITDTLLIFLPAKLTHHDLVEPGDGTARCTGIGAWSPWHWPSF